MTSEQTHREAKPAAPSSNRNYRGRIEILPMEITPGRLNYSYSADKKKREAEEGADPSRGERWANQGVGERGESPGGAGGGS